MTFEENNTVAKEFAPTVFFVLKNKGLISPKGYRDCSGTEKDFFDKIDMIAYLPSGKEQPIQIRAFSVNKVDPDFRFCFPLRNYQLKNKSEFEKIQSKEMDDVWFVFGEFKINKADSIYNHRFKYGFVSIWMCTGEDLRFGQEVGDRIFEDGHKLTYVKPTKYVQLRGPPLGIREDFKNI